MATATSAPPLRAGEAALAAGEEVLQEMVDAGRVKTVNQLYDFRLVILENVEAANEREGEALERAERAEHWRERVGPELAEAMLTTEAEAEEQPYWRTALGGELAEGMTAPPANEKWPANRVASMIAELGIHEDRIDVPALAKEGVSAMAFVAPLALHKVENTLHRELGIADDAPIPEQRLKDASKKPGDAGSRARLALALLAQAKRSARR